MPELAGRSVQVVDIAADDELLDELGERIPVLEIRVEGARPERLFWPFDSAAVARAVR